MLSPSKRYWVCQWLGWGVYSCFYFYINSVGYIDNAYKALLYCAGLIIAGVALTTGYRSLLLRFHWLELPLKVLLSRVLLAVIGMAAAMTAFNLYIEWETFPQFVQDITPILLVRYGGAWLELFVAQRKSHDHRRLWRSPDVGGILQSRHPEVRNRRTGPLRPQWYRVGVAGWPHPHRRGNPGPSADATGGENTTAPTCSTRRRTGLPVDRS
nr:hypothetical protein [Puia dinghuensis]